MKIQSNTNALFMSFYSISYSNNNNHCQ